MSLAVIQVIRGENFPSDGLINLKAYWGQSQHADLEDVPSCINVAIQQEVVFRVLENDERIKNQEKICLRCWYISPSGLKTNLGAVYVSLEEHFSLKKWFSFKKVEDDAVNEPAILICTFFESDGKPTPNEPLPSESACKEKDDLLRPVLINGEFFRIGSISLKEDYQMYVITVTVSFAENLIHLFPPNTVWPSENSPFQFRFSLFGNQIHLQPFSSLRDPVSIAEKATAKVQSSPKHLIQFLYRLMEELHIYLCCDDLTIGEMVMPIGDYIKNNDLEAHIFEKLALEPINISGIYPLKPSLKEMEELIGASSLKPQVGVLFMLTQVPQQVCENLSPSNDRNNQVDVTPDHSRYLGVDQHTNESPEMHQTLLNQEHDLYAAALELEIWKEEQKLLEQEKLQRSSRSHMELWNSEYRRLITINEINFQHRVQRIEDLEKKLENAIQIMRESEQELQREKLHLSRLRAQLCKEKTQISTEVERVTQRLQKEYQSKLEAERRRNNVVVDDWKQKYKAVLLEKSEDRRRIIEFEKELNEMRKNN